MTSQFIAAAASVALIGAGFASAEGTRSIEAIPAFNATLVANDGGGKADKCRVDVFRGGTAGTADIRRYVENNGTCVCTVTTGEKAANGNAEDIVDGLLRDRSCEGAPAPEGQPAQFAPAAVGVWPLVAAPAGAGGLAAAVGSDSNG
ncbi:MAG: hypothetical protein ACKOPM_11885 [Novosphingobium sp.]